MLWGFSILILALFYKVVAAADINKTAYYRMPPLYLLDPYEECLVEERGYYCIVNIDLVSTNSSSLYDYILEYSSNRLKHYRHDTIHRGICVTKTCQSFFNSDQELLFRTNETYVQEVLGKCINASLEKQYGLQGNTQLDYCKHKEQTKSVDGLDVAVAVIIVILFILNAVCSYYDYFTAKSKKTGSAWLLAFSFQRNWRKLTAVNVKTSSNYDPRLERLKPLQGMRFISMMAVIFSHVTLLLASNFLENPIYVEVAFEDPVKQLVFNGSLIMQTYFCISSLLVAYNFMLYIEKNPRFNILVYPKGLLNRWLRLVPVYALVIGFVATWPPHMGSGPLWDRMVTTEQTACRANWWTHLLFFNNYISLDLWCLPQTWYLAADTQLFCYSLAVMMIIWRFPKSAKYLFPSLVVIGVLIPAVITYIGNYSPTVMQTPEAYRTLYKYERTFQDVYQRGHTNTVGPSFGLWAGYFLYYIQKKNLDLSGKIWYQICVYAAFPLGVAVILTGAIFYQDGYVYSPLWAGVYAGIYKAVFSLALVTIMVGVICGLATPYRKVMDWRPFQIPGKLTFCALFVHPVLQRAFVGSQTKPFFMTDYLVFNFLFSSAILTYILAVPLCIMVEMPANILQKLLLEGKKAKEEPAQSQISKNITLVMNKDNTHL